MCDVRRHNNDNVESLENRVSAKKAFSWSDIV